MRLAEAQRAFARLIRLRDHEEAAERVGRLGVDPDVTDCEAEMLEGLPVDRLELYQALIRGSNWNSLAKTYIRVCQVIDDGQWRLICRAYFDVHPPCHWDLNGTDQALPDFLREVWLPAHPELPAWLADLAEYERLESVVYLCADEASSGEPALHTPQLNPTLQLQSFGYDVAGWIREHEARGGDELEGEPPAQQTITAFYRDPDTHRCRFLNVNPLTALALQGWNDGASSIDLAAAFAPQLGTTEAACLEQLEALARSLAASDALRIEPGEQ